MKNQTLARMTCVKTKSCDKNIDSYRLRVQLITDWLKVDELLSTHIIKSLQVKS